MALVRTYITSNGATVNIFDDYIPKDPEEYARRRASVERSLGILYRQAAGRWYDAWRAEHPDANPMDFLKTLPPERAAGMEGKQ